MLPTSRHPPPPLRPFAEAVFGATFFLAGVFRSLPRGHRPERMLRSILSALVYSVHLPFLPPDVINPRHRGPCGPASRLHCRLYCISELYPPSTPPPLLLLPRGRRERRWGKDPSREFLSSLIASSALFTYIVSLYHSGQTV